MTDEQIQEIVQINESIKNCYLNAMERTDADREYREGQRKIAKWLEELVRFKEKEHLQRLSDKNHKCIYLSDDETTEYCVDSICPKYKTETQIKSEAINEFVNEYKNHINSFTGMFSPELGFTVSLDAVLYAVDFISEKILGRNGE